MDKVNTRFEIKEIPIGKGAFGEVYLGKDKLTNKAKAIKIMKTVDEKIYENEVNILKKIAKKHCFRHVICLTDYFIYKKQLVLVTDKIEGISLNEFLKNKLEKSLNKEDIKYIIYQLVYALRYIHEDLDIAHLDIKPANIMIDPTTLELSIIDFGLSCENKCMSGGTLDYMSPEYYQKFRTKKKINIIDGKRTDMYALGVIIYQLIFGKESIDEYGKDDVRYELRYGELDSKKDFIKSELKGMRKSIISILKATLDTNKENRKKIKELYKMIKKWNSVYKKRIEKPVYIEKNIIYKKEDDKRNVGLLSILDKAATLINE